MELVSTSWRSAPVIHAAQAVWVTGSFWRPSIGRLPVSRGMSSLARDTGISREALYKAFSDNGNPTLDTLLRVMKAFGVRLAIAA